MSSWVLTLPRARWRGAVVRLRYPEPAVIRGLIARAGGDHPMLAHLMQLAHRPLCDVHVAIAAIEEARKWRDFPPPITGPVHEAWLGLAARRAADKHPGMVIFGGPKK